MAVKYKTTVEPTTNAFIVEPNGKRSKGVWIKCGQCSSWFVGRYFKGVLPTLCSIKCRNVASKGESVTLTCCACGDTFTRIKSKHERNLSFNKTELVFCSRLCKDTAQSLNSDFPELRPDHYGTGLGLHDYRDKALAEHGAKCKHCDITHLALLEVHHADGDRLNNNPSNLEVLCGNHHLSRHMRFLDGAWVVSKNSLTPRDKIVEVLAALGI